MEIRAFTIKFSKKKAKIKRDEESAPFNKLETSVDYKIATKTIALRLEKILPSVIYPYQSDYAKGRFIGESIRPIADTMDFTKLKNIPGIAVFLDFEKAFDSIEWDFIRKCLESLDFGPNLRQWISVFYKDISSCVINNGVASKQYFYLERGVRQGCPLSGILFVIAMELLAQRIKRSKRHQGHTHPGKLRGQAHAIC